MWRFDSCTITFGHGGDLAWVLWRVQGKSNFNVEKSLITQQTLMAVSGVITSSLGEVPIVLASIIGFR